MRAEIGASDELARFASEEAHIPDAVRAVATALTANFMACAISASANPEVTNLSAALVSLGNGGPLSTVATGKMMGPVWAATVNGAAAASADYGDFNPAATMEVGAVVVPAVLAVAELTDCSCAELVDAVAIGAEIALRIGMGLQPSHGTRGWDASTTCGGIGAAIAAGRVLRLDHERMTMALALGATQASGVLASRGTLGRVLQRGHAAGLGVESALLASQGFTGATASIEGRRGLGALTSRDPSFEAMVLDLGRTWGVRETVLKPYACSWEFQSVIAAALRLRSRLAAGAVVKAVDILGTTISTGWSEAEALDEFSARFSLEYCLQSGIRDGAVGPQQFTADRIAAVSRADVTPRIRVHPISDEEKGPAVLKAQVASGGVLTEAVTDEWLRISPETVAAGLRARLESAVDPLLGFSTDALVDLWFHPGDGRVRDIWRLVHQHS